LSRLTGRLSAVPIPRPLRRPVLGVTARLLGVDLSEARDPVESFRTLDEMFVRRLREGVREWPSDAGVVASPVDGVVGAFGRIEAGALVQAKGRGYTVAELLDDDRLASWFGDGSFVTLYLAPRHYHRIHAPVGGLIRRARHVPGRLLPVNRPAVNRIDRLFPRNERLIPVLESAGGEVGPGAVAVVAVGAFNVGRITAEFDAGLETNRRRARPETRRYDPPVVLARGDPLMAFHLGSTVVLLFERPVRFTGVVVAGREVRLGAALAEAVPGG
jgi:phosphatidylserine decarboxylase